MRTVLSRIPGLQEEHISFESVKVVCSIQPPPHIETIALTPDSIRPFEHAHAHHRCESCSTRRPYAEWLDILRTSPDSTTESRVTIDTRIDYLSEEFICLTRRPCAEWLDKLRTSSDSTTESRFNTDTGIDYLSEEFRLVQASEWNLYREIKIENGQHCQLVITPILVSEVLRYSHEKMGHSGRDRTTRFIRDRFVWPGMTNDIDYWIRGCRNCVLLKTPPSERAPLTNITTSQPLELVSMDYLLLETLKGGYPNILVITDHFTKYAVAIPTRNQTAKTVAEAFFNNFIIHNWFPKRIHADQGANFELNLIKEWCKITGMEKSRTTPYHPMSNGITEALNRWRW